MNDVKYEYGCEVTSTKECPLREEIRANAIDECIAKIDTLEQISFGIVETELVKAMLEELKEQI